MAAVAEWAGVVVVGIDVAVFVVVVVFAEAKAAVVDCSCIRAVEVQVVPERDSEGQLSTIKHQINIVSFQNYSLNLP